MATRKTYISGGKVYNQDDDVTTPRDLQSLELGENVPASRFENGGADEISLADLSGAPADTVNKTGAQTIAGKKTIDEGAIVHAPKTYTPAGAATATLDLALGNNHEIQMPAGNITIAISNETNGQYFTIDITQDDPGSRTVTWFSTIKWAGGVAPTLTTTADKRDSFGFKVTGADTYDGFVIGANI